MYRTKKIKHILKNNINDFTIKVVDNSHFHKSHNNFTGDGETHIMILLKSNSKSRIKRLEIHKKINSLLKEEFKNGLHSLEIKIIL